MLNRFLAVASVSLLGALAFVACYSVVAQEEAGEVDSTPDFTVTATFGEYDPNGLLDYSEDGWCEGDREVTQVRLQSPYQIFYSGLALTAKRSDVDAPANIYGSPERDTDFTQSLLVICEGEDASPQEVSYIRSVRVNIEGDANLVPRHAREHGGGLGYIHDLPHPTHVAEIDALETRVAEAEARSFVQATQLADAEATVEVDVTAIAALKTRDTQFGSQIVNIESTVEIHATQVFSANTKATGNQRALGLHIGDNTKHNTPGE